MENKEFTFKGMKVNGFVMLFVFLAIFALGVFLISAGVDSSDGLIGAGVSLCVTDLILLMGFVQVEPNEARVMMFFGKYRGTFSEVGFYWVNPFISTKKLSLRARNLNAEPIKVNDKIGNPVMIGLVLVWKLKDTYKAMFEIDSQTMAQGLGISVGKDVSSIMRAFENFVMIQSEAALRQVAGQYAYDNNESNQEELTLRDGDESINKELEMKLAERLEMAGIEIVEARINYLAYAPEIAAVMLRRQQASAVIMAREKIVEGAVSMVKMAIDRLSSDGVIDLDDDKKAAMVSNLMVVLCGDDTAQPVVNTGTLNM
ncbi:SPFH/Band 7/PHB domain protein [Hoylesella buccalis ATCC 35310]|uniref:SPFH/Band 7/PHB domain protein n=1 Tax=Hoylesella buccalis ATCC 35310 TaxID=679190 RepID=D1W7J6_9BACT|nr:SPFH domain-containing protein [Hoylesella buccalis]EFA91592.1 SPFH/Band 7/PHB domain protein [Hoylesella buccalis ATCC 35310]